MKWIKCIKIDKMNKKSLESLEENPSQPIPELPKHLKLHQHPSWKFPNKFMVLRDYEAHHCPPIRVEN